MSALFSWSNIFPASIMGASLLGSAHCVAMCGGIVLMVARDKSMAFRYHLGRLLGYISLGFAAGAVGKELFSSSQIRYLSEASGILLSFLILWLGVQTWRGRGTHLFLLPPSIDKILRKLGGHGPFAMGIFTALLPCGWLHSFLLAAVASGTPTKGALTLFFFWLGTVPALQASPWAISRILQPISQKLPKLSAICLIILGMLSIGLKLAPTKSPAECPVHSGMAANSK